VTQFRRADADMPLLVQTRYEARFYGSHQDAGRQRCLLCPHGCKANTEKLGAADPCSLVINLCYEMSDKKIWGCAVR
jgi:hypothetical protein